MGQVIDFKSRKVLRESKKGLTLEEWSKYMGIEHPSAAHSALWEAMQEVEENIEYKTAQMAGYIIDDDVDEVGIIMEILHEIKITLQNIEEALDDQS